MSNLIFCEIDDKFCNIIKDIAKEKIIIDCGAGRGLFASMYDGKVISIDIQQPDNPLSLIRNVDSKYYCFPINSIPIFIRPCHHRDFVQSTLINNEEKFTIAIYVSKPENLSIDLDLESNMYEVNQYSKWEGKDGEKIYIINFTRQKEKMKILKGKIAYLADPMFSFGINSWEQEFHNNIEIPMLLQNILIDGRYLKFIEGYKDIYCDYLFFDWGGMSIGNSILENYCEYIIDDAEDHPNRNFIVVGRFSELAMQEAKKTFGEKHNIFNSLDLFVQYFNEIKNNII